MLESGDLVSLFEELLRRRVVGSAEEGRPKLDEPQEPNQARRSLYTHLYPEVREEGNDKRYRIRNPNEIKLFGDIVFDVY